jgi:isopenicillin-N N-acyltransferase-like protein
VVAPHSQNWRARKEKALILGEKIPLIEITGDERTRGQQYGEAAREQIGKSIAFYREVAAHTTKLSWDEIQTRARLWMPVIDEYFPGILDEVRGIAEGSGRAFEEILALNGRTELTYGGSIADEGNDSCSSFAITSEASGDGHVYCGQNWDWLSGIKETIVILRVHQPPKPTIIMQVEAGQVGRHGANSAGLALCANGLGRQFGKSNGVPSPYIRRRVLDSANMNDALEEIFKAKQNGCTNLLLAHKDGVVISVETTPGRHGWMYPTDGILVHTNHFIAFVPPQIAETYRPTYSVDSLYRLTQIQRVLKRSKAQKRSKQMRHLIATALSDHFGVPDSVCAHPKENVPLHSRYQTVASCIMDLTNGDYYLAPGLPCESEYVKLPRNIYDSASA